MNERRTHLDLFSGIGGFALAARWAGFETVGFCEREPFAQRVLRKNFPGIPIHDDVRELDGRDFRGATLLTGGFPCQPYSQAGKRRGEKDDRALWGEMARVIQEARPRWLLGENVVGLVSLGLDEVLADLEGLGYSCEPVILPACAVDAPHRRDRVWIIAHASSEGGERREAGIKGLGSQSEEELSRRSNPRVEPLRWIPEPGVRRVAHGIPDRLHRLRGLGNAIVPQVAYEILRLMR